MPSEQMVLTREMSEGINASLRMFVRDSQARCALLITRSGQLVSQLGFTTHLDVLSLCALAAGIFTTTQELARLIGESRFKSLFQEGKVWNLHFTLVSEDLIFATLFDKKTVIGVVHISAREASERIAGLLGISEPKAPASPEDELEEMKRELAQLLAEGLSSQALATAPASEPQAQQVQSSLPPPVEEKKGEKPLKQLAPDFEDSAAAALDRLFGI